DHSHSGAVARSSRTYPVADTDAAVCTALCTVSQLGASTHVHQGAFCNGTLVRHAKCQSLAIRALVGMYLVCIVLRKRQSRTPVRASPTVAAGRRSGALQRWAQRACHSSGSLPRPSGGTEVSSGQMRREVP